MFVLQNRLGLTSCNNCSFAFRHQMLVKGYGMHTSDPKRDGCVGHIPVVILAAILLVVIHMVELAYRESIIDIQGDLSGEERVVLFPFPAHCHQTSHGLFQCGLWCSSPAGDTQDND